ncbi:hypothetical protein LTR85_011796 [Meristemomyces frigidus]|nr:hypothetical protein LTR85_011796 [Meristemomyces frigidus]
MAKEAPTASVGVVLAEDELKQLSRNVRNIVPGTAAPEDVINKFKSTLDNVLASAASPGLNAPHRVAAWNTLCALIDRIRVSDCDSVRKLLWDGTVWSRAFDLYLTQGHLARPKSARQLLATLTTALRDDDSPGTRSNKQAAAHRIVATLNSRDDHGRAKTSALALGHLLTKGVLTIDVVLEAQQEQSAVSAGLKTRTTLQDFLLILFGWMSKGDFGSTIAQVVSAVLDRSGVLGEVDNADSRGGISPLWTSALTEAAKSNAIEMASLRVHLLPVLFKRSSSDYLAFLQALGLVRVSGGQRDVSTSDAALQVYDQDLLYASLQAGKDIGMLWETTETMLKQQDDIIYLPVRWVGRLLLKSSRNARLTGLSLLISSPAATRPLLPEALNLIKRNLSHYFADTDANFRSEVFSLFQHLIDRVRAIVAVLARHANNPINGGAASVASPSQALRYHQAFLDWLIRSLVWELRPTASYQRHISALKCLFVLVRSGLDRDVPKSHLSKSAHGETRWPIHVSLMTPALQRTLLDLVVDPFDDVRQTASSILGVYTAPGASEPEPIRLALSRAEAAMLATGRADQADGVAQLYTLLHSQDHIRRETQSEHSPPGSDVLSQLLDRLEQMLRIAKMDLSKAVDRYPVHGLLTSIRYILERETSTLPKVLVLWARLCVCLETVWEVVKPILCNDAPEGYLPEGLVEKAPDVTTKDTLSYCWRALKEASLLLGVLVSAGTKATPNPEEVKDSQRLNDLCGLCFAQLAELRHRGAFSTVAQTWITCCTRSSGSAEDSAPRKLYAWYDRVLLILRNKTTINTRRSAGLPSLLCGILVAELSGSLMTQAFTDLETIARELVDPAFAQEGSLPQVHAMNCMKDILKNSRLGEQSERHVPAALKLAAGALRSQAWAVRNCGLMLFRAVIDRLLGTSVAYLEDDDAFARKKLSAEQHPELLEIVLGLLATPPPATGEASSAGNEGVFPALQLLQRLTIPEYRMPEVRQSVRALTASRVWHVRDKAARAYASLISCETSSDELRALLGTPTTQQNALHGALLSAKYITHAVATAHAVLGFQAARTADLVPECMRLVSDAAHLYHDNTCPITRGAYLDLHTECLVAMHQCASEQLLSPVLGGAYWLMDAGFEWEKLFDEAQRDAAVAVVLPNIAAAFAAQLAFMATVPAAQSELVRTVVAKLASQNPGACIVFLNTVGPAISRYIVAERMTQTTVLTQACMDILSGSVADAQLRCKAVEVLLEIADRLQLSNLDCQQFDEFATAGDAISKPMSHVGNHCYSDLWLQLQAAMIENRARHQKPDSADYRSWADACCTAATGSGSYSVEAAALALGRMDYLWAALAVNAERSSIFLQLCLAVYGLLNNDDEDIRDVASQTACRILATERQWSEYEHLAPAIANQRLLAFLIRRWRGESTLFDEAALRAFGISASECSSVAERLQCDAETDTALFAEEKQNLYIDEAREVKAWSQVLLHLPAQAFPSLLLERLGSWVSDGLNALADRISTAPDVALGWTTKPELFVLGLQVVYGAEVLLDCAEQGVRMSVPPSRLRKQLVTLSITGDESGINGLWQREIDRVLSASTTTKLRRVYSMVRWLQDHVQ